MKWSLNSLGFPIQKYSRSFSFLHLILINPLPIQRGPGVWTSHKTYTWEADGWRQERKEFPSPFEWRSFRAARLFTCLLWMIIWRRRRQDREATRPYPPSIHLSRERARHTGIPYVLCEWFVAQVHQVDRTLGGGCVVVMNGGRSGGWHGQGRALF